MEAKKSHSNKIFSNLSSQLSELREQNTPKDHEKKSEELSFQKPFRESKTKIGALPKYLSQPEIEPSKFSHKLFNDLNPMTLSKKNIKDEKEDYEILLIYDMLESETFMSLFSFFKRESKKYSDKDFLPGDKSLCGKYKKKPEWSQIEWLRPNQFFKGEYKIFQKSLNCFELSFSATRESLQNSKYLKKIIQPQDILQGMLDNCYFLASLSSLAEYPKRVKNLFITRKVNNYGIYCVRICFKAQWQAVYIDDFFPCHSKTKEPIFTKGNGNELWVLILEKAYAKLYGSYAAIEKGYTGKSLRELTGAPTQKLKTDDSNLWEKMFDSVKKGFILTASSGEDFTNISLDMSKSFGLIPKHAYSIISIFELKHKQLGDLKLIKLRNPWGIEAWKGPWSSDSKEWTKELREKLNYYSFDKEDGIFFMELKEVFVKFLNKTKV